MIKLDDNLLQELGLTALSPEEKKKMLAHIYETLEMRVGMELAKQMTDAQLSEFEEFINRNDEAGALRWLESNFPNYKAVVAAEFDKLKLEIKQVAPHIVASSQQQAANHQAAPAPPPAGSYQAQPYAAPPSVAPGGYSPQPPMPPQQPHHQYPPAPPPPQQQPYYPPGQTHPPHETRQSDYDLAA
jgi:hypothetical protein